MRFVAITRTQWNRAMCADRPPVSGEPRLTPGECFDEGLPLGSPRSSVSGEPSTAIYLNDRPYSDGEEDPFRSLGDTLAFSVDDWGHTRAMAWVWGIILGWDDEAMAELAALFGWDEDTTARLNRLHTAFEARATPPSLERWEQIQELRGRVADMAVLLDVPNPKMALEEAIREIDYRLSLLVTSKEER